MIRSIAAVLAGIVVLTITSFAVEAMVNPSLLFFFPTALPNEAALHQNQAARLVMYTYTTMCIVCGGYATAWIARRPQLLHSGIMGIVQVGLTLMAMSAFPDKAPFQIWVVSMLMTVPAALCGGFLRTRRLRPA